MHTDPAHAGVRHHKPRHLAERFEKMIVMFAVAAVLILGALLIWSFMQTGQNTPTWMR